MSNDTRELVMLLVGIAYGAGVSHAAVTLNRAGLWVAVVALVVCALSMGL